jgi:hypothetical protein
MDRAISAFKWGRESEMALRAAAANVRLWAKVKALTVFSSNQRSRTMRSRPSTNKR